MFRAGVTALRLQHRHCFPIQIRLVHRKPTAAQIFRKMSAPAAKIPLQPSDRPLVWIDCEMTGLDHRKDKILEIAVLITNGNLEAVDEGIRFAIKTDKTVLDKMEEWCTKTHGESGLTAECLAAEKTTSEVEELVLAYIKRWVPFHRSAVLAGSSVHVDRMFLLEQMPSIINWLHYRIIDCSTVKELAYRWYPALKERRYTSNHRALDDIKGSIAELAWHRRLIFKSPQDFKNGTS